MSPLLRKDRPWMLLAAVLGTAALGGSLHEHSGARVFVVGADRLENAFHVAWIAGVVLGAVAACFDEILGTREFLAQRPIARAALIAARLRGVLLVLAAWFVLAPIGAWVAYALFHDGMQFTRLAALPAIFATWVVALSGAGIGLAAGSLPAPWWQRLMVAAAWFGVAFMLVHEFARGESGVMQMRAFVAGHLLVAAFFFVVAAICARHDRDADRPWPHALRWVGALPVAVALAALWAANCREGQASAIQGLESAYPSVVKRGDEFMLVRMELGRDDVPRYVIVDGDHRSTGKSFAWRRDGLEYVERRRNWFARGAGFDVPMWHRGHQHASNAGTSVLIAADGHVWTQSYVEGFRATGRGADHAPFAPGSSLGDVGDAIVVVDAAVGQPSRYDAALGHFAALQMPAGERCEGIEYLRVDEGKAEDAQWKELLTSPDAPRWSTPRFVRGLRDAYTVREGALIAIPGLRARADRDRARFDHPVIADEDPLVFRMELPAGASPPVFVHEFRPRTAEEWWHAGAAISLSALRSPVLQITGNFSAMPRRAPWLFDRVVADGRRPWLVLTCCALAGIAAFFFARRLRRLGASPATMRLWTGAIVLLGLPALLVAAVIERPRAYARRGVTIPAAPPRIVTVEAAENVA